MNRREFINNTAKYIGIGCFNCIVLENFRLFESVKYKFEHLTPPYLHPHLDQTATNIHYYEHFLDSWRRFCIGATTSDEEGLIANHLHFWNALSLSPSQPDKCLLIELMNSNYDLSGLKQDIMNIADKIDGSGWISVGLTHNGKIEISNYPGEYNHIQNSLINFDLWEHAYYLQFKYDWEAYVNTLYGLIDWKIVGMRYRKIRNSMPIA